VVACAAGDAHEGKPVRLSSRHDHCKRPIATGDAQRIRAARHDFANQRGQVHGDSNERENSNRGGGPGSGQDTRPGSADRARLVAFVWRRPVRAFCALT
jgi:hypothetical protein